MPGNSAAWAAAQGTTALAGIALELRAYLPSMQTIVRNARRAQVAGETVPASERVFSLFEQHTELIKRGKRQKPVEFGHKVCCANRPRSSSPITRSTRSNCPTAS